MFVEPQYRNCCFLSAFNHGAQQRVLRSAAVNTCITRDNDAPALEQVWYNDTEIDQALNTLSGGILTLRTGHPHYGVTQNATWAETLSQQLEPARSAPFLLLCYNEAVHIRTKTPAKERHT